jgi:signal transduction histidine kinase
MGRRFVYRPADAALYPEADAGAGGPAYSQSVEERTAKAPRWAADLTLVALLALLSWLLGRDLFATGFNQVAARHLSVAAWIAATGLAAAGYLLGRRLFPEIAVVATATAAVMHTSGGWPLLPADLLAVAAVFLVAYRRSALIAAVSLVAASAAAYTATGLTVAGYRTRLPESVAGHGGFPFVAALLVVAWFWGATARHGKLRQASAQRVRDDDAQRAARLERERVARDIHDVIAHGLSVMIVQAQGAAAALTNRPERTSAALDAIVTTGRSSLAELRQLLETGGSSETAPTASPALAQLDDLVATASDAGLSTTLTIEGDHALLPAEVAVTAYRVVQEALTNAIRHAGCEAHAVVRLDFTPQALDIDITDTGNGTHGGDTDGRGLNGMRARVALLGGTLHAGDLPQHGFQVHATIPLQHGR